jgi:hypothetical protein
MRAYQTLPGGLIVQWGVGSYAGVSGSNANVSFPLTFPTGCFCVTGSIGSLLGDAHFGFQSFTTSQFNIGYYSQSGSVATTTGYFWVALGN